MRAQHPGGRTALYDAAFAAIQRVAAGPTESKAVVLVTHDMTWVTGFCTRAILLENGKMVMDGDPQAVVDEVKAASLLGRGGAGFPAGTKWGLMPQGKFPRYLVVNGDESEPGTYKDRLLMERDPHQLIEGCLIAAYAAGLSQVFLYIRGEMPLAHERGMSATTSFRRFEDEYKLMIDAAKQTEIGVLGHVMGVPAAKAFQHRTAEKQGGAAAPVPQAGIPTEKVRTGRRAAVQAVGHPRVRL